MFHAFDGFLMEAIGFVNIRASGLLRLHIENLGNPFNGKHEASLQSLCVKLQNLVLPEWFQT